MGAVCHASFLGATGVCYDAQTMQIIPYSRYRKLVLVCTNEREGRTCCKKKGSGEFYDLLKQQVKERVPFVRVTQTRCLGHCLVGTTVVIMPDNIWLGEVEGGDIDEIIELLGNG